LLNYHAYLIISIQMTNQPAQTNDLTYLAADGAKKH